MPDPVTGDSQSEASPAGSWLGHLMSRVKATLLSLVAIGAAALGMILGIGIGNLHGQDWALAGLGMLVAAWFLSYYVSPTALSARIGTRLQPVAVKAGVSAVWVWV